jgi:hypothetical protein
MSAFETFTSVGYQILLPLFELFTIRGVPIALSVAFFVVFGFASLWLFWVTERPRRQIKQVARLLRRIEGQREFTTALPEVAESMAQRGVLQHAWQEFEETLIKPEPEEFPVVRNTARPSEYFNHEASGLTFSILHALPNYFVGLGLLFTFFGIVAALYFASAGVTGTIETAQHALVGLLSAATFKFLTSIAGLICSILFSLLYRWRIRAIDRAFAVLCNQLERLMSFAAPEQIAANQLRQLNQQTLELKRFNTNIAMEIADAMASKLDASIADGLRRAIDPLTRAIERLSEGMTEDIARRGLPRRDTRARGDVLDHAAGELLDAVVETGLGMRGGGPERETDRHGDTEEAHGAARSWGGAEHVESLHRHASLAASDCTPQPRAHRTSSPRSADAVPGAARGLRPLRRSSCKTPTASFYWFCDAGGCEAAHTLWGPGATCSSPTGSVPVAPNWAGRARRLGAY